MNLKLGTNTSEVSEKNLDKEQIFKYLNETFNLDTIPEKKIKKYIMELLSKHKVIMELLARFNITEEYFIEILISKYAPLFTPKFVKDYRKILISRKKLTNKTKKC